MASRKSAAADSAEGLPAAGPLRVTIERSALLRALTSTTKAVENRNTYPILANVLLIAEPASLTVRATDLDIEITTTVPAECVPGSTTVPAKTLLDIVRKFGDGAEVMLEQVGIETLTVSSGRSRFRLPTIGADSFPALQVGSFGEPFTTDLAALFGNVAFAISDDSARYYLNGVYLHTINGRLRVVATDGHRLARADGDAVGPTVAGIIIPKKTVALLPPGPIQVEVSDTKIRLTAGDTVIVSKLIEGTFPDYDRVTPKNNDKLATIERAGLMGAVDRVSIVASERGGRALRIAATSAGVALSVTNAEGGSATEDVPGNGPDEELVIGCNANYLADILRAVGGATVKFAWADPGAPMLITGDNDNWLSVLMPMRVA
jgi:DNA polymerase-3 subunit beta